MPQSSRLLELVAPDEWSFEIGRRCDMLNGVVLTPLKRVQVPLGDVLHVMKATDPGFAGFGEAYFTMVRQNAIKGWKRHTNMTLNLVCPIGAVRIVVHDGRPGTLDRLDTVLSPNSDRSYQRLTVRPGYWVGFQGVSSGENMLINIASIVHDPAEAENVALSAFPWPAA